MSVIPPRPPYQTENLKLPLPGGAEPPDYITATRAIIDRLDAVVRPSATTETTLPANPTVNQEVYFRAAAGPPPIWWRLRYNGSTWDFLGGGTIIAQVLEVGPWTLPAETWAVGDPTINVPLAGVYELAYSGMFGLGANPGFIAATYVFGGAATPDDLAQPQAGTASHLGGGTPVTAGRSGIRRELPAGPLRFAGFGNVPVNVYYRTLSIRPIGGLT